ncbi:MAG: hypothetical protein VX899_22535 [Myxococcota bacterium]|nr:hypothetical protein [Myxococcota bacterium]
MGEGEKVGRGLLTNLKASLGIRAMATAMVLGVLACMGLPLLCAGLVDEKLFQVVGLLEFMAFPFVVVGGALILGSKMRVRVLAPLKAGLDPHLGPHKGNFGAAHWSNTERPRPASARYYKYNLQIKVDCATALKLQAGLQSKLAATGGRASRVLGERVLVLLDSERDLDRLLAVPGAADALGTLIEQDGRSLRSVFIGLDGRLVFMTKYLSADQLTEENVGRWLDALDTLAHGLERVGPKAA